MCRGRDRCMVSGRGRIWFRCRCSFTDRGMASFRYRGRGSVGLWIEIVIDLKLWL